MGRNHMFDVELVEDSPRWASLDVMNSRGSKDQKAEQELDVKHFWEGSSISVPVFTQFWFVPCLKCTITIFLQCSLQVVFALGALFNTFWLMEVGRFIFG